MMCRLEYGLAKGKLWRAGVASANDPLGAEERAGVGKVEEREARQLGGVQREDAAASVGVSKCGCATGWGAMNDGQTRATSVAAGEVVTCGPGCTFVFVCVVAGGTVHGSAVACWIGWMVG